MRTQDVANNKIPIRLILAGLGAAILLAATVLVGLYLGFETRDRFASIDGSWRSYSYEADRRGELLIRIKGLLGYGGVIHNFKNYVLRQDDAYLSRVRMQFRDFKATVSEYRNSKASQPELLALESIAETIALYEAKIPIAITAARESWPPTKTDQLVKVDDTNAFRALAELDSYWRDKRHESTVAIAQAVFEGQSLLSIGFRFIFGLAVVGLLVYLLFYFLQAELRQAVGLLSNELTERKAAEHEAKKLARAVEQSPATIIITGTDGIIEYVNTKFCDVSGFRPAEVLGRTPRFLQSGDTPREQYLNLSRQIAQGREWRGMFRNRKKDGGHYWAQTAILPLRDERNEITHYIGIGEDVTERRHARQQIQKAQKMEAVGLLASGLAHDFNNVLTTIIGNAHLARLNSAEDGDVGEELTQIEIAAKRASNLVAQVLAFARRQPGDPEPLRVSDAMKEVVRLMRASIRSNVALDCSASVDDLTVMADPTRLHQVVLNLCSNAAEAIGADNGQIKLHAERVWSEAQGRNMVRLTVSDNGPGIAKENRGKVFDPFFSTKAPGRGTGLGLSVVANLVADMHGQISILESSDAGTCFEIHLPESEVVPKSTVRVEHAPRGSDRILLVDDEPEVVATLRKILENLGYDVEGLTDPQAAVTAFEATPERYDLVITDFIMPEMNGEEVCKAVRKQRATCPVVICSAYRPGKLDIEKMNPLRILDKPVDPTKLAITIREMLDAGAKLTVRV